MEAFILTDDIFNSRVILCSIAEAILNAIELHPIVEYLIAVS
jgi:hypothetical protein